MNRFSIALCLSIMSLTSVTAQMKKYKQQFSHIVALGREGNYAEAIAQSKKGIASSSAEQQDSAHSSFSFFAGLSYQSIGNIDSAEYFLHQADSVAGRGKYLSMQVRAKLKMIDVYHLLKHDLPKARTLIDELIPLAKELNDARYLASVQSLLAYQEKETGNYDQALQHYLDALDHYKKNHEEVNEALTLQNIGVMMTDLKKYHESLEYYKGSIALFEKNKREQYEALSYLNLGTSFLHLKLPDSAKWYFSRTIEIAKQYDDASTLASAYHGLAQAMNKDSPNNQETNEINSNLNKSLEISQNMGLVTDEAESKLALGITAMNKKEFALASKYLTGAMEISRKTEDSRLILRSYLALSELSAATKKYRQGYDYLKTAFNYQDSLYREKVLQSTTEMEARYQNRSKQQAIDKLNMDNKLLNLEHRAERQQYWIASGVTAFIILIAGILYYYENKQRLNHKDKELQQLINRVNETRQVALRAQMNPHFIFNCMSAIDDFILKNERLHASELLTSFAHLVRLVLEHSERNMISLQEELSYLDLYLKVEQLRFNHTFVYHIEADDDIEFDIPPLLLQPYVENAIIHGIGNSPEKDKKIEIIVRRDNADELIVYIRDNGLGITQSSIVNSQRRRGHQSMGMRLTEERMRILKGLQNIEASVAIDDLDISHGTEVKVRLKKLTEYSHVNHKV